MNLLEQVKFLLEITSTQQLIRRYFVVNGFDGALTMLGIITGFLFSAPAELSVIISACVGAAVALGVSGVSSAYISEVAERRHALSKLEDAMVSDLRGSAHADAARLVPIIIAVVNGFSPLMISILIITPLWLADSGTVLAVPPLYLATAIALLLVFLLGVFLGRVAEVSWIRSGFQTLFVAIFTASLIYLLVN